MEFEKIKVYIKTDDKNRITDVNSSIFITDFTDWIEIDEGEGDRYAHAQGMYFEKPLMADDGTHNYMYEDGNTREATEEEHEAERKEFPIPPDTEEDALREMAIDHEFRIMCLELGLDASDFE